MRPPAPKVWTWPAERSAAMKSAVTTSTFSGAGQCPQDPFSIVVGDVTGHGVDAALLMATARAFLRMRASQCGGGSQIVTEMNRQLARDVADSGRFMTLSVIRFDLATTRRCNGSGPVTRPF